MNSWNWNKNIVTSHSWNWAICLGPIGIHVDSPISGNLNPLQRFSKRTKRKSCIQNKSSPKLNLKMPENFVHINLYKNFDQKIRNNLKFQSKKWREIGRIVSLRRKKKRKRWWEFGWELKTWSRTLYCIPDSNVQLLRCG